ncbi:hypothetical protein C8R31_101636 [Nitrosospira sp. Nsp2]|nr:hypothetical protein C8R31_101636 [Nitrosospira sp. Nsp2]
MGAKPEEYYKASLNDGWITRNESRLPCSPSQRKHVLKQLNSCTPLGRFLLLARMNLARIAARVGARLLPNKPAMKRERDFLL